MKKLAVYFCILLLFLLPLKFGGLAVMPEAGGFYPEYFSDWLTINWPPHSLAFAGSLLLIMTMAGCTWRISRQLGMFFFSWCLVPAAAAVPGMIRGDMDMVIGEWSMLLGCASVIMSAGILVYSERKLGEIFAAAILAGGIFCAFYGWYQHLVMLDEMRAFAAEQEALGIPVSEGMRLKLTDPRIYSTLASSNTLASMLMIMLVLGFYFSGRWSRYVTPPGQAKWVLRIFFAVIFLSVLFLTRSRSVILCALGVGIIALFSTPKINFKWRIAGLLAAVLMVSGVLIYAVSFGRGVASMGERADYLRTTAVLCMDYPLAGAGWGGFFRTHMQIKKSDVVESARDPHNVVAAFAGQCGIPAGLLMAGVLILPLILLWKERFAGTLAGAVFWCGIIFTIHSLIDCDWQVPALIAVMGSLYACALSSMDGKMLEKGRVLLIFLAVITIAGGVWSSYYYLAGDAALSRLQDKVNPPSREIAVALSVYPLEKLVADTEKYRPDSAVVPMLAGDWYFREGNLAEAEKNYRNALRLDPVRPAAYARLARLELLRGNRENAEKYMLEAQRLFPKNDDYTLEKLYEVQP